MSFSLTSPISAAGASEGSQKSHSNIYLSPMAFLHFWRWWHLFDTTKTKPVRTGQLFPDIETAINKFGQALASLKYRFSIDNLFITHVYKADTRTTWRNGETPFIGVKALVAHLEADLHQSSQEATIVRAGKPPLASRTKRFTAANLTLSEVELRLLAAVFADPNKQLIALKDSPVKSHQPWLQMEPYDTRSRWVDMDDFVELLWTSVDKKPRTYLSHLASCPRFTYSKHSTWREPWVVGDRETAKLNVSKFGNEDTHVCLLGYEPCEFLIWLFYNISSVHRSREAGPTRPCKETSSRADGRACIYSGIAERREQSYLRSTFKLWSRRGIFKRKNGCLYGMLLLISSTGRVF